MISLTCLPQDFVSDPNLTFFGSTTTSNATINAILQQANQATFIAYDVEFLTIVGANPVVELIEYRPDTLFAFEAGIWVPTTNEVWFSSALSTHPSYLSILNLNTKTVSNVTYPEDSNPPIIPNSGTWLARTNKLYMGNAEPGGIWTIDAKTHQAELLLNGYFGLSFPLVSDVTVVTQNNIDYLFFTVVDPKGFGGKERFAPTQLPNGVWRYDVKRRVLVNVIGRNQGLLSNGIRFAPDQRTLYVTDTPLTRLYGPGIGGVDGSGPANGGGQYIWRFKVGADMRPTEQTLFAFVRSSVADGIHVDDAGRVWTAEFDGIIVRNAQGKKLGVINALAFGAGNVPPIEFANFALAGDTLVVLAGSRLWTVKLAQTVVSPASNVVD